MRQWPVVFSMIFVVGLPPLFSPFHAEAQTRAGRPRSPSEGRRLDAEIARLSSQVHVREAVLRQIAGVIGERFPDISFDELLSKLQDLAAKAADLQVRVSDLEARLSALSDPAIRSPALAAVARAKAAFDAGRLEDADAALAELEWLRRVDLDEGLEAWLVSVEARSSLAVVRLDPHAGSIAGDARRRHETQSRQTSLRLANMEADSDYAIAMYLSDGEALAAAIEVYSKVALPLALEVSMFEAAKVRNNLADSLRLRFRQDQKLATLIEARHLFENNVGFTATLPQKSFHIHTVLQLAMTDGDIASFQLWMASPKDDVLTRAALAKAIQGFQTVLAFPDLAEDDPSRSDATIGLADAYLLRAELNWDAADIQRAMDSYTRALRPMGENLTTGNFSAFISANVSVSDLLNLGGAIAEDAALCLKSQNNSRTVLNDMAEAEWHDVRFQQVDRLRAKTEYAQSILCQTLLTGADAGLAEAETYVREVLAATANSDPFVRIHATRIAEGLRTARQSP